MLQFMTNRCLKVRFRRCMHALSEHHASEEPYLFLAARFLALVLLDGSPEVSESASCAGSGSSMSVPDQQRSQTEPPGKSALTADQRWHKQFWATGEGAQGELVRDLKVREGQPMCNVCILASSVHSPFALCSPQEKFDKTDVLFAVCPKTGDTIVPAAAPGYGSASSSGGKEKKNYARAVRTGRRPAGSTSAASYLCGDAGAETRNNYLLSGVYVKPKPANETGQRYLDASGHADHKRAYLDTQAHEKEKSEEVGVDMGKLLHEGDFRNLCSAYCLRLPGVHGSHGKSTNDPASQNVAADAIAALLQRESVKVRIVQPLLFVSVFVVFCAQCFARRLLQALLTDMGLAREHSGSGNGKAKGKGRASSDGEEASSDRASDGKTSSFSSPCVVPGILFVRALHSGG